VATHEDSRPSIGELWLDINKLDDPPCEDTSVVHARNALIHRKRSAASIGNISKCSRCDGNKDSLADVAGMSRLEQNSAKVDPREGKLRGSCLLHLVLFLRVCEGLL
jgi:hypothetical protein